MNGRWAVRIALIAILVPFAWYGFTGAAAAAFGERGPQILAAVAPGKPDVLNFRAALLLSDKDSTKQDRNAAKGMLLRSIKARPLDTTALRLYSAIMGAQDYDPDALIYLKLADRVSRRDYRVELALLGYEAKRGQTQKIFDRINNTLRSSLSARDAIYPLLNRIIAQQEGREAFAKLAKSEPDWIPDYLSRALDAGADPGGLARLIILLKGYPQTAQRETFERSLLGALDAKREYSVIERLLPFLKSVPTELARSAALTRESLDAQFGPLSWSTIESAGVNAYPTTTPDGKAALSVSLAGGLRAEVARRLLFLPPANYRFSVRQSFDSSNSFAREPALLEWKIVCIGQKEGQTIMSASGRAGVLADEFEVKRDCPAQLITLDASAPGEAASAASEVSDLLVAPR